MRLGLDPNIQNPNKLFTSDYYALRRELLLCVRRRAGTGLGWNWAGLGLAWLGWVVCGTSTLVRDLVLVRQVLRVQQYSSSVHVLAMYEYEYDIYHVRK